MVSYEYVDTSVDEEHFHPGKIVELEQKLAREFLLKVKHKKSIDPCPISGASRDEILFKKWGWSYALSEDTWSISLSSFPSKEIVSDYNKNSKLSELRASKEYQEIVLENRRDIWENQIDWIKGRIDRYLGIKKYQLIDWGSRYTGWLECLKSASFIDDLYVHEPLAPIQEDILTGNNVDVVLLIDVLQREIEPAELLKKISASIKKDGLLIIFCRAGSGFDILTLRENSDSIFPLDHIVLPSPKGLELLLNDNGYEILEITTPGLLDMKILEKQAHEVPKDQYLSRYILQQNDDLLIERMQVFLQRNNLSSHMRCIAKKK